MKKRLGSIVLITVILGSAIPFCPARVAAQGFAGGSGTAEDPYQIADWCHLNSIRYHLSDDFVLLNDLDSGTSGYAELAGPGAHSSQGWQPIGDWDHRFEGTFHGQACEIRNLTITRTTQDLVGLFAGITGGTIEAVGMVDADVTANDWVGGLVGINDGTLSNCYTTGSVGGHAMTGGMVGINDDDGTVRDCHSMCSVDCSWGTVGGLVGINACEVSRCYATGSVSGDAAGGLVGSNAGMVSYCYAIGSVTGSYYVGGLVGLGSGTVSNCYATGSVNGSQRIGGLMGAVSGTVNYCYSAGGVTGSDLAGGLIGDNDGTVDNSFWDTQISGLETSAGGTGKTTGELMRLATFGDWDISAVAFGEIDPTTSWNVNDGHSYPFLACCSVRFELQAGWNMVSMPPCLPQGGKSVAEVFGDEIEAIYEWDPVTREYGDATVLEPLHAYWVAVAEGKIITYFA